MAVGPKVSLYGSVLITPGKTTIFAYTYDTISCTVSKKKPSKNAARNRGKQQRQQCYGVEYGLFSVAIPDGT